MGNLFVTQDRLQNELDNRIGKLRNELVEMRSYETGKFYRALKSTWDKKSWDFSGAAKEWESHRKKDDEAIEWYNILAKQKKDGVRYFKDSYVPSRLFPESSQSMAHLIPNDPSCSVAWLRPLSIITGVDFKEDSECPLFSERLRSFVEGKAPVDGSAAIGKDTDIPLKAWNWNFLMLPEHHEDHFDKLSSSKLENMIATPVWDPKEKWIPGTGYKLMVAASPKTYQWLLGTEMEESEEWFGVASEGETEKATNFLALTVRALADLLAEHGEGDLVVPANEHKEAAKKREKEGDAGQTYTKLENVFKSIEGAIPSDLLSQKSHFTNESASTSQETNETSYKKKANEFVKKVAKVNNVRTRNLVSNGKESVQIPTLRNGNNMRPVLVVDLGRYFKGKEHLIPDPFLVVLKAAVSWSDYCSQKLLPACGNHSDHHQERSDVRNEELIPVEIIVVEDTMSGDDDSVFSLSEALTGPPGDGNFEAMSTVSPSGTTAVRGAVVTP